MASMKKNVANHRLFDIYFPLYLTKYAFFHHAKFVSRPEHLGLVIAVCVSSVQLNPYCLIGEQRLVGLEEKYLSMQWITYDDVFITISFLLKPAHMYIHL